MRASDFLKGSHGDLLPIGDGLIAFRPRPLPPDITPGWSLMNRLEEATRALYQLAGLRATLPNPHLLLRPFLRREAVTSSRIEGTQASLSDVLLYEAQEDLFDNLPVERRPPSDTREVLNYVLALEHGLARMARFPVSLPLIREMHQILLQGTRGGDKNPGHFRRTQVHIGRPGASKEEATFVPPPPGPELMGCLDALEKYIHAPSPLPHLIRHAMIHYQFEAIHPFMDGNGRIGRILFPLLMAWDGLLPEPMLYLSAFFDRRRDEYYGHLLRVSTEGAWVPWIEYVLTGIAEQSKDALHRSQRLLALQQDYRRRFVEPRASALVHGLVDYLFMSPFLTIKKVSKHLRVSHQAAAKHVGRLVHAGVLEEITGRERNRVFLAREVLSAVDDPLEMNPERLS